MAPVQVTHDLLLAGVQSLLLITVRQKLYGYIYTSTTYTSNWITSREDGTSLNRPWTGQVLFAWETLLFFISTTDLEL